jgi:tetratricopeptide (TPR) repeat protein
MTSNCNCRFAFFLLTSAATFVAAADAEAPKSSPRIARTSPTDASRSDPGNIEQLISQLGSEDYYDRRHAEEQLIQRGADVFDQLRAAEEHSDLEIATRAHYILQRIRIAWVRPEDSAEVHAAMDRYGELSHAERRKRKDRLLALADDEGLGALCRIARYELSPQLARAAALAIMQTSVPNGVVERIAVIRQELGDTRRVPVEWLRAYGEQLEQPDRVSERWLTLIDEELALLAEGSSDTKTAIILDLIDYHLELCRNSPLAEAVFAGLQRRTDLYVNQGVQLENALAHAMNWLWENEQWEALALFEDYYDKAIRKGRLLIYMAAAARWKQGRDELAEEFAERAYKLEADDEAERTYIGDLIGEMGRHDWAEREWWFAVEALPVLELNSIKARRSLALLRLHDRGEDRRAAELMVEILDALESDPKQKRTIERDPEGRYLLKQIIPQKDYLLACHAAAEGKRHEQRKYLEAACARDPQDPDVLIAMYRLEGTDEEFRKQTVLRIQHAIRTVDGTIKQEGDNPQLHNHWAWLVSNTEGDYAQAVEHSLRSLELSPDNPSYLDTLGRCYYSAGKLKDAIRVQREAIRLHPHLQVMRDQLELFESAMAKNQNKSE